MSYAARKLKRAVEVYHFADAIGCDAGVVEYCRGVAASWAACIIAAGLE